jgi:hypothetical protein
MGNVRSKSKPLAAQSPSPDAAPTGKPRPAKRAAQNAKSRVAGPDSTRVPRRVAGPDSTRVPQRAEAKARAPKDGEPTASQSKVATKAKAKLPKAKATRSAPIARGSRPPERLKTLPPPPENIVPKMHPEPRIQLQSEPPPADRALEDEIVLKWAHRGARLLRMLSAHGAREHEFRVDLREGRFVWISPDGRVSAEARAQALCSYAQATSALTMAWADPLLKTVGIHRIDRMPSERDALDEEQAWRVAMRAAEASGVEYIHRVAAPNAWYFIGLRDLTFQPARSSFTPGTPVGLVLRGVEETRQAILSRAEPAEVVRDRLSRTGSALLHEADYAYRGTDWVARLSRAGKRLLQLAETVPRTSFDSVAQGTRATEWLSTEASSHLEGALTLLEDEWRLFA